jgi:hypothetical protein
MTYLLALSIGVALGIVILACLQCNPKKPPPICRNCTFFLAGCRTATTTEDGTLDSQPAENQSDGEEHVVTAVISSPELSTTKPKK